MARRENHIKETFCRQLACLILPRVSAHIYHQNRLKWLFSGDWKKPGAACLRPTGPTPLSSGCHMRCKCPQKGTPTSLPLEHHDLAPEQPNYLFAHPKDEQCDHKRLWQGDQNYSGWEMWLGYNPKFQIVHGESRILESDTSWPRKVSKQSSVAKSQYFTVVSSEPENNFRPSTEKRTALHGLHK